MKYTIELSLKDFNAWNGGLDTLNELKELDKCDEVENYINENMENLTENSINDFLWFERDFIFEDLLGITEEEN